MEVARKNELALIVLKNHYRYEHGSGITLDQNFRRKVGNIAKSTGVPYQEMLEFFTNLSTEILMELGDSKKPPTDEELEGVRIGCGH